MLSTSEISTATKDNAPSVVSKDGLDRMVWVWPSALPRAICAMSIINDDATRPTLFPAIGDIAKQPRLRILAWASTSP